MKTMADMLKNLILISFLSVSLVGCTTTNENAKSFDKTESVEWTKGRLFKLEEFEQKGEPINFEELITHLETADYSKSEMQKSKDWSNRYFIGGVVGSGLISAGVFLADESSDKTILISSGVITLIINHFFFRKSLKHRNKAIDNHNLHILNNH